MSNFVYLYNVTENLYNTLYFKPGFAFYALLLLIRHKKNVNCQMEAL